MSPISVTRIAPQSVTAVQVSLHNSAYISGLFAALLPNGYNTNSQTNSAFPGGWRLTIQQDGQPDMWAYPDDWIVVTDAAFASSAWTVSKLSTVSVYGVSTGLAGNAADFVATFTANTPLDWVAETTAPTVTAEAGAKATLTFPQPDSPCGPFTYAVTVTDETATTTEPATVSSTTLSEEGVIMMELANLPVGHTVAFSVAVSTQYAGTSATSAATTPITIEA